MLTRCLLSAVLLFGASSCKGARGIESKKAATARGQTFTIPVPKGYSVVTDERLLEMAPHGAVLIADKRVASGAFIGSIVVTKVAAHPATANANTEAGCPVHGEGMTRAAPVRLEKPAALVDTAAGASCQWSVIDKANSTRRALGTVMYKSDDNAWVVTCNYDIRDVRAVSACEQVLQGFKFDA